MEGCKGEPLQSLAQVYLDKLGQWGEPELGMRRVSVRQHQIWHPPTDVYETDECIVIKVEIAGMQGEDLNVSLDSRKLTICGVRHDPAAKLGYQQMEIQYGYFETDVHLPKAIDEERIEAIYRDGFLSVRLPKAMPRQVPVVGNEESA